MSRAAGGTYSLPAGNPVVTGTIISSTWGNTTLTDIATALTDSLSRSGLGGMTAALLGTDGAVGAPAFSFTNEPASGLYRIGAGSIGMSVLNRLVMSWGSSGNIAIPRPASGVSLTISGTPSTGQSLILDASAGNWGGMSLTTNGSSQWGLLNGIDAAGEFALYNHQAGASQMRLTSAGNFTFIAPSSGVPVTVNNTNASTSFVITNSISSSAAIPSLSLKTTAGNGFCTLSLGANAAGNPVAGTNDLALFINGATSDGTLLNRANAALNLGTNATARVSIAAAGNVTINGPASGIAATINGFSGTHSTQIADSATALFNAGYLELPINTQNTAYQTVLADAGKAIYHSDGTARTYTIPANGTVAYPIGTTLTFINDASGAVNVTIAITTDTLQLSPGGTTGSRTLAQFGRATAHKVAATKWIISGTGLS